jgi:hypothetical protein
MAVVVGLALCGLLPGFVSPSSASACSEFTQFLANEGSFNAQASHGVLADIRSEAQSFSGCDNLGAGGTSNMILDAINVNWVEIGWEEVFVPHQQWYLFTEWGKNDVTLSCNGGQCVHSSGCPGDNQVTTFKVVKVGAPQYWEMSYACDGGGYTNYYTNTLTDTNGIATVEAWRHDTWSKDQRYTSTEVKVSTDVWYFWSAKGGAVCDTFNSGDAAWAFHMNADDDYSAVHSTTGICSSF